MGGAVILALGLVALWLVVAGLVVYWFLRSYER
jgi:hypothetical protein